MDVEKLIERLGSVKRGQSYADAIYDAYGQLPRFQLYDDLEEAAAALAKLQAERDEAWEAVRPFAEANCRIVGISSSADDPLVGYAAWTEKALSLAHFRAASRALGGGE